jgi:hypothetical protein
MTSENTLMRKQSGIALITTLLLLLLMSAMVVGFMLLVTEGQRLSGMDSDQMRAFYGAESGMEKLTADLGSLFATTYAPAGTQVDALMTTPPVLPSSTGVSYVDSQGTPTYSITYPKDGNGNPLPNFAQITSGSSAFQGMSALETTYTLTVGALTNTGGNVKLVRTTQTVGIPLFQFGIFSDTDLSFFPGPNFDFGGRVHTNGNLFLNSGGPAGATPTQAYPPTVQLWMRSPVTASKDIMRDCLSNTNPESATGRHPGSVEITKGGGSMQALGFGQGSLNSCLGSGKNPNWPSISGSFNGNLRSGVRPLNLTITLLGNGISTPVDMIRRPAPGELGANPGVLGERYFSEASLRVLLSDNSADITSLPCVSAGAPFNLADLALPVAQWATTNATNLKAAMTTAGTTPVPLAASGAAGTTVAAGYNSGALNDGYWQVGPTGTATPPTYGTPIITGYIKIDEQTSYGSPCGVYKDVTQEILSLGYAGRNINPVSLAPPQLPSLPGALVAPSGCLDPHPNAIIRLERVRDNPSTFAINGGCGVSATVLPPNPSDYWPNALFDSREGYNRQSTPGRPNQVTLGGIMNYIELDVKNLAKWFSGTLPAAGSTGPSTRDPVVAPNNFVVYISDRRGNYLPAGTVLGATPVLSPSGHETGEYGYDDLVNRSSPNGCPDGVLEPAGANGVSAEDLDGTGVLSTYGENTFPVGLIDSTGVATATTLFANALNATALDPGCPTGSGGITPWPRTFLNSSNEGRQNPNALFRRAVKIMDGNVLTLPACPGGIPCGLSIATENPAYIQGDFNANSAGGGFADPSVAASVDADAVTILSNNWNDVNSFASPFNVAFGRTGATTYIRAGIMAGKQIAFNIPNWDNTAVDGSQDFGTDGGVHNFLRFLEKWNGTLFYEGSIVSMYYSRQATGLFNSGGNNYSPPTRGYSFDVNFLNPTLLPPRTPMFRDVNTTGFTQLMLPSQ